jgi:hypothetical protein
MLQVLLLLPVLASPSPSPRPGKRTTISVDGMNGELRLTWDAARLPEARLRALADLAPETEPSSRVMPDQIDLGKDAGVDRARATLAAGREMLKTLQAREVVPELEPVKAWLVTLCSSWLEIEERKLAYMQHHDLEALKRPIGPVDPKTACKDALAAVAAAGDRAAQWDALKYKWHNCVNDQMQTRAGDYPKAAWKKFLSTYGIKARYRLENPD